MIQKQRPQQKHHQKPLLKEVQHLLRLPLTKVIYHLLLEV